MPENCRSFNTVSWDQVADEVRQVAPDIFTAIQSLTPDNQQALFIADYAYGDAIIDDGKFQIPLKDKLINLNSKHINPEVKEALYYHGNNPPGLILQGHTNQFLQHANQTQPDLFNVFNVGDIIEINSALRDKKQFQHWNISAGTRLPTLLTGIGNNQLNKLIRKEFNIQFENPNEPENNWHVFTKLANSKPFKTAWKTRLLLFPNQWLSKESPLRHALLEREMRQNVFNKARPIIDHHWQAFTKQIRNKQIDDYAMQFSWHMIESALDATPIYKPYQFDDKEGPFNEIINIILDIYKLKNHAPILMVPHHLEANSKQAGYTSIAMPTKSITKERTQKYESMMRDQRNIQYVLNHFQQYCADIDTRGTPLHQLKNMTIELFNTNQDQLHEIQQLDPHHFDDYIQKHFIDYPSNQALQTHHKFLRAMVKVSAK